MRHAQGQFPAFQHAQHAARIALPLQREINLPGHACGTAQRIRVNGAAQEAVAVDGIVEFRDRLRERGGGEVLELHLEAAKGQGALPEHPFVFRMIQAQAVADELIHAVITGLFRLAIVKEDILRAVIGGDQREHMALVQAGGAQMACDGGNIVHQGGHVPENVVVDLLQYVGVAALGRHQMGAVDVPASIGLAGNGLSIQAEPFKDIKHGRHSSQTYLQTGTASWPSNSPGIPAAGLPSARD